jgi:hypothetical protein
LPSLADAVLAGEKPMDVKSKGLVGGVPARRKTEWMDNLSARAKLPKERIDDANPGARNRSKPWCVFKCAKRTSTR